MEDNFNIDNSETETNKTQIFIKKLILIAVIAIILLIVLLLLRNKYDDNDDEYKLEFDAPDVMYIGEPLEIPVKLTGPKTKEEVSTNYFSSDEGIIELLETEFSGRNGSIYINPLLAGKDKITIVSTIGADKYTKTLTKITIPITVCPTFDANLIPEKEITINKGTTKDLNINFGDANCSKVIIYETNNSYIATVSPYGQIKGENIGTAMIVVSNGSNNITITVKVI